MKFLNKALLCAALVVPGIATAQEKTVIDLLVVYTQGTANAYSGDPSTRFNHLIQATNQIYVDSGVDLELRIAHSVQVNYSETNNSETALRDMTFNQHSAFNQVAGLREVHQADMVVLYRPYADTHGSCGIAWIGGMGTNGDFSPSYIKDYQFAHVAVNQCGDYVTAHELGHNLGLRHSRKQDGSGGTTSYALGHGVDNSFTTIMAYQSAFNVDYWTGKVYKFSNPEITCKGMPCGVSRGNSNGADARYTLNMTGPQVANFYGDQNGNFKTELQDVFEQLQAAEAAYELAMQNFEDSKAQLVQNRANLKTAKATLREAKKAARTAARLLKKSTRQYERYLTRAQKAQEKAQAAYAAYQSAATLKGQNRAYNRYVTQTEKYNLYTSLAAQKLAEINAIQPQVVSTSETLNIAIAATEAAKQAVLDEKALKIVLRTEMRAAKASFKTLNKQYNRLLASSSRASARSSNEEIAGR